MDGVSERIINFIARGRIKKIFITTSHCIAYITFIEYILHDKPSTHGCNLKQTGKSALLIAEIRSPKTLMLCIQVLMWFHWCESLSYSLKYSLLHGL